MSVSKSNLWHVVDQPAGTGFSYVSTDRYAHTLTEVEAFYVSFCLLSHTIQASNQLLEFLRNFYDVFPEYRTMDVGFFSTLPSTLATVLSGTL